MLNLSLDRKKDILYIKINDTGSSYGDETENGVVVLKDMMTDTVTGITIFDFIRKHKENKKRSKTTDLH